MTPMCAPTGATTRDLVIAVQRDGADAGPALDQLLAANASLIRAATARVDGANADFDVFHQEARLAFVRAVQGYEPSRGASLASHAYATMTRAVQRAVRHARRATQLTIPLVWISDHGGGGTPEPTDDGMPLPERAAILDAVRRLPAHDRAMLFRLYWKDEVQGVIARCLGVSQQMVSKRHRSVLAGLNLALSA